MRTAPIAALALLCSAASAHAQVLDFEGTTFDGAVGAPVGAYYAGVGGPNYGITFSPNAVFLCLNTPTVDCSATSRGGRGNPASQYTGMIYESGGQVVVDHAAGFTDGFSMFYTLPYGQPASVNVYGGFGGTGALLGSVTLAQTGLGTPPPCYGAVGIYCPFDPAAVAFAGTAHSVVVAGPDAEIAFDDLTFGSLTPGVTAPEPSTFGLLAAGAAGVLALARRRTQDRRAR